MSKKYDYVVFIGRFQPFHLGHKEVLDYATSIAEKVLVIVGSNNQPRTPKNPFSYAERAAMIWALGYSNVKVASAVDKMYNDQQWVSQIQDIVIRETIKDGWTDKPELRIGIIGHEKDSSSFYLKLFPQWELIDVPLNEKINATDIRQLMFEEYSPRYVYSIVPETSVPTIKRFIESEHYTNLKEEYEFIKSYKKTWDVAPYPPTFVTTDAVVIQSGHVLMIKRRAAPGKGLWALPGGFLGANERLEDSMIRELREETKLKVPDPVLRGSIKANHVFDHPGRSSRGRTITHAFLIELNVGALPKVKGSDDADKALWVPLASLNPLNIFEDHYSIIQYFVGQI